MAIIPNDQYPGKTAGPTANYPLGEPRNITTPGDGTGTPWDAALVKDLFGFQQALLKAANITASGDPDTALVSQYLQALQSLFAGAVSFTGNATQWSVKLKIAERTLCIKGGNVDYTTNPGETSVTTTFSEAFPTLCAAVLLTRKMNAHTQDGDGGAHLVGTPSKTSFVTSLQVYNINSAANLRGFSWVAFGW